MNDADKKLTARQLQEHARFAHQVCLDFPPYNQYREGILALHRDLLLLNNANAVEKEALKALDLIETKARLGADILYQQKHIGCCEGLRVIQIIAHKAIADAKEQLR